MLSHDRTLSDEDFAPWFAKAQEMGEFFREIGMKYDAENTFAYPTIKAFKESRLGGIIVPTEFGGAGANIEQLTKCITEMSRGDSAITLAYNMHFISFGLAMANMSDTQMKQWAPKVAEGAIVFGPWSEARAGFSGLADTTAIPQPGGGWKLYGKKSWGTLSEAADIMVTSATITDADGNVPTDFEERVSAEGMFIADFVVDENGIGNGVRIEKSWNAMGMHATGTQIIHFEGYYIPEDSYVTENRAGLFGSLEWATLLFASIYYGMSLRILEESRALLSKKTLGATFGAIAASDTKVAGIGHIVDGVGEMAVRCEVSRRIIAQTCTDVIDGYDDEWPIELRVPYIGIAKTVTADNVTWMAKKAMSLVGGSAFRKGTIFERLYRDSCAALYQPLNADQTNAYIGEYMLQPDELND
ncbi:MAG: acyl-CoA dehydrogenase family protein [Sporichthyaceae bacterium]